MAIMIDASKLDLSIADNTFDKIGEGFRGIMKEVDQILESGEGISSAGALKIEYGMLKYTLYQEGISKVTSKFANGFNEVMKAN